MNFRCLFASNMRTPAATDKFKESNLPSIGILIFAVAFLRHSSDKPVDSVPMIIAEGLAKLIES